MEKETLKHLDAELAHAGEETALSPLMLQLEKLRITPERELPPMDFLFRLFDKPCFPRRELVAITGKAKSGKTFLTSMLVACCQAGDVLALHRQQAEPLRVLWYDTEQSDESTQDILKNRIMRLQTQQTHPRPLPEWRGVDTSSADTSTSKSIYAPPSQGGDGGGSGGDGGGSLDVFNVRAVEWKLRRSLLAEAVRRCRPDLAIVDGIRDLVNDINDGVLAQEVMEELMQLAAECMCCIVCVLHQNKSGEDNNLRGWIGTELMNKAFEVYSCEKLLPERIFRVEQTLTRKYDIDRELYFQVDGGGLPVSSGAPADNGSKKDSKDKFPPLNRQYIVETDENRQGWRFDVERIVMDALQGEARVQGSVLRDRVMSLTNIQNPNAYNVVLHEAIDKKLIVKKQEGALVFYEPTPF